MTIGEAAPVAGLLLVACWTDVSTLRIPDWISVAIVALFVIAAFDLPPNAVLLHVLAGALVGAAGVALFAAHQVGGGDVKLLTALALWLGWQPALFEMLMVISVAAAIVSAIVLIIRLRLLEPLFAPFAQRLPIFDRTAGAPFGVAIGVGFWVMAIHRLSELP